MLFYYLNSIGCVVYFLGTDELYVDAVLVLLLFCSPLSLLSHFLREYLAMLMPPLAEEKV